MDEPASGMITGWTTNLLRVKGQLERSLYERSPDKHASREEAYFNAKYSDIIKLEGIAAAPMDNINIRAPIEH